MWWKPFLILVMCVENSLETVDTAPVPAVMVLLELQSSVMIRPMSLL